MWLRRLRVVLCTVALCLLAAGSVAEARIIWVAKSGSDVTGNGTSGSPYATPARAVAAASQSIRDTVMVRAGTYIGQVIVDRDIVLMSEQGAAATILDGEAKLVVVVFLPGIPTTTILDGFTITRGIPHGIEIRPSAASVNPSSPEIRNCRIRENGNFDYYNGGGIQMEQSAANIHHNTIERNWASAGGGIYSATSSARIWNNQFIDNEVDNVEWAVGGGILVYGFLNDSEPTLIQNNIFRGNKAKSHGTAVYAGSSEVIILNNLFYQNTTGPDGSGTVANDYYADPLVQNNIFVGNSRYAADCNFSPTGGAILLNNAFYLNQPRNEVNGCTIGPSNLQEYDPEFVNEALLDFHLQPTSPLINAGAALPPEAILVDFDGKPRVRNGIPDIGPFERLQCLLVPDFSFTPTAPCEGQLVSFSDLSSGFYEWRIWDYGNGDRDTFFVEDLTTPSTIYNSGGQFTVTLTLVCENDTASVSKPINVTAKPRAIFTVDDSQGCIPFTAAFTNTSTGPDLTYLWDFGDGGTSTQANPTHQYTMTGAFWVKLTATNLCGSHSDSLLVSALDVPVALPAATPLSGSAPLPVLFTGAANPAATSWSWQFGDGSSSTLQNANHTYEIPGIYRPSLQASNLCGSGPRVDLSQSIRVAGFDLKLIDRDTSNALLQRFTFVADTLFGTYDRQINLTTAILPAPRRGSGTVTLTQSAVSVLQNVTATVTLTPDFPAGDFTLRVIGRSVSNFPVDTLFIPFRPRPQTMAEVGPLAIDFDSVQVDSVRIDSVLVRNISPFPLGLTLRVLEVLSLDTQFVPLDTQSPVLIPNAFFYVRVQYKPATLGPRGASLQILTDDPLTPLYMVSLSGVGIPERVPPTVVSTQPADGESDWLIGRSVVIEISEPIDRESFDENSLRIRSQRLNQAVAGEALLLNNARRIEFTASQFLPPLDTLSVTLSGNIRDRVGNTLDANGDGIGSGSPTDDFIFRFHTGPAVFPGDCNNDGVVNEIDILPLGVFWALSGPARAQIGGGTTWRGQQALIWDDPRATYADANGDGVIDMADVLVIGQNWGSTHTWAKPTLSVDFKFEDYTEAFLELRAGLQGMAGSEVGNRLLEMIQSVAGDLSLPTRFALSQNHPNPFNPETRINYAIPEANHVRLTIHNILGQTVRVLLDEFQSAGFRYAIWDGRDQSGREVSSGVYFYRLESGSFVQIRKMMKVQ